GVTDRVLVDADQRGEVLRRAEAEAQRAEAEAAGLLERRRAAAGDPQRRVRLAVRLRQHVALGHGEVRAVVAVARLAPHAQDLAQRLVEHRPRRLAVGDAEALELGARRAAPG